jgi:hypothetical protein
MASMPTPTARRKMIEDQKSAAARAYLEGALPFGMWAEVSKKIGHNHAFIQQFIRRGKPRFLAEAGRDLLARTYNLDAEILKPPRKTVRPLRRRPVSAAVVRPREKPAGDDSWINPRCDNLINQSSKAQINHLLDQLSAAQQAFVLRMILAAVGLAGKPAPGGKDSGAVAA